jgi:hypothetical protein
MKISQLLQMLAGFHPTESLAMRYTSNGQELGFEQTVPEITTKSSQDFLKWKEQEPQVASLIEQNNFASRRGAGHCQVHL